jgi:FkbM family methyltransferase
MAIYHRLKNSINLMRRSRFHYYRNAMLRPPFRVRANGRTCLVAAGDELGAGTCYSEVVVEDCYGLFAYSKQASPRVIVDIGANIGVFSKLCSMLFPDADIYAYEPNPKALKWLAQNAEGTRIGVIPSAVGEHSGRVSLDTSCDSTIGRVVEAGDLTVDCLAASEVAEGREIGLLKIDCEGSEFSILQDLSLLERTQELRLEFHLFDGHSLKELQDLISSAGHRIDGISKIKEDGKFGVLRSKRIRT